MKVLKLILSTIILLVVLAIGFVVFTYYKNEKKIKYWDRKVKELCKKDGGVVVFETVNITKSEYKRLGGINGVIPVPGENTSEGKSSDYISKTNVKYIHEINPTVRRIEHIVYRKKDMKVLGKWVIYSRVGGDIPTGIGHESSFSCSQMLGFNTNLEGKIFSIEGTQQ